MGQNKPKSPSRHTCSKGPSQSLTQPYSHTTTTKISSRSLSHRHLPTPPPCRPAAATRTDLQRIRYFRWKKTTPFGRTLAQTLLTRHTRAQRAGLVRTQLRWLKDASSRKLQLLPPWVQLGASRGNRGYRDSCPRSGGRRPAQIAILFVLATSGLCVETRGERQRSWIAGDACLHWWAESAPENRLREPLSVVSGT